MPNPTKKHLAAAREICQLAHRELYRDQFVHSKDVHQLRAFKSIEAIEEHYARILARHFPSKYAVTKDGVELRMLGKI